MIPTPNGFKLNFNFAAQDNGPAFGGSGGGGLPFPAMATGPPFVSVTTTRTSNAADANGGLSFSVSGDASARAAGTPPLVMMLEMLIQGKRTSIENQKRNVENLQDQLDFLGKELASGVPPLPSVVEMLIRGMRRAIEDQTHNAENQERNVENLEKQLAFLEQELARVKGADTAAAVPDTADGKVDADPSDGDLVSLIRAKRRTIKAQERNLENLRAQLALLERDLAKAPSAPPMETGTAAATPARGNGDDDDDAKAN